MHRKSFGLVLILICITLSAWLLNACGQTQNTAQPIPTEPPSVQSGTILPTRTPMGISAPGVLGQTASIPQSISPNETAAISFTLNPQTQSSCLGIPGKPMDAIILIDNSPSLFSQEKRQRVTQTIQQAQAFADQISAPVLSSASAAAEGSRIGSVISQSTGSGADTKIETKTIPLDTDFTAARTWVDTLQSGSDTVIEEALPLAQQELAEKRRAAAQPAIIFIVHDDAAFTAKAIAEAKKASGSGIKLFMIGVGEKADITASNVQEMVGSNYKFAPTPQELYQTYIQLTGGRTDLLARDVQVTNTLQPEGLVDILGDSISNGGTIRGASVVWQISQVTQNASPITLSYRVRGRPGLEGQTLTSTTSALYLDCNGNLINTNNVPSLANIQGGLALPTVVAGINSGTGPNSQTGGSIQPPPSNSCTFRIPIPGISQYDLPCWLLLFLLLIPLILFLLWLLLRRRPSPPEEQIETQRYTGRTPIKTTTPPEPEFEPESGKKVTEGQLGYDEAELIRQLREQSSWLGNIRTRETGNQNPNNFETRVARSAKQMDQMNLATLGAEFIWRRAEQEPATIPVSVLNKALRELPTSNRPLIATWNREPSDNFEIKLQIEPDDVAKKTIVNVIGRYRATSSPQPLTHTIHIQQIDDAYDNVGWQLIQN